MTLKNLLLMCLMVELAGIEPASSIHLLKCNTTILMGALTPLASPFLDLSTDAAGYLRLSVAPFS